ncbi:MAG TPA: CDP-diacylglycerol--glycerol-3-phosphate 3-phosphatidyltransferase [Nitrospiraceae bacterium]|jgi:CDP-diacylglycerol--glycerol-3-phosphate 3-phosphatidyltransferase|nr:CDP-diacylglycerol--glycerol-3-phosphate 3-phosphatidyltransferase [Nitrospiraceae bacterium]
MRVSEVWKQAGIGLAKSAAWDTNINLPNFLTVSRILLIPVFVVLFVTPTPARSVAAAVVFVVAAVTDMLDGYLARRRSQITKLGRLLDPIADKLLVLSALILLVQCDRVSALVTILIIAREVAVTGIRAIAATEGMILSAELTGKYKMALQVVAVVFLVLEDTAFAQFGNLHVAGTVTLYVSLVLGYVSGAKYLLNFWRQVTLKEL